MTGEFVVEIKKSARVRNNAVEQLYQREGKRIPYPSQAAAEETIRELATQGTGPVRLQAIAPQDDTGVDGYVVGASRHDIDVPRTDPGDGWTFGVNATQYGELGEALITAGEGASRALKTFVRYDQDLAVDVPLDVRIDADPDPVTVPDDTARWAPDCTVEADVGHRTVAAYYCEVKTGTGGLERTQEAAITAAARDTPVLLLWVDVTDLPDQYEVQFEKIDHTGPGRRQEQLTFADIE